MKPDLNTTSNQNPTVWKDGHYVPTTEVNGEYYAVIDGVRTKIPQAILHFSFSTNPWEGVYAGLESRRSACLETIAHYQEVKDNADEQVTILKAAQEKLKTTYDAICANIKKNETLRKALFPDRQQDESLLSNHDKNLVKKYNEQISSLNSERDVTVSSIGDVKSEIRYNDAMYIFACHEQLGEYGNIADVNNIEAVADKLSST